MKVIVDRELCHSNANCLDEWPEVFGLDDEDRVVVLDDQPSEKVFEKVRFAALCCPRAAITVVD